MRRLRIASGFSLPVDVAGEAIAILAKRGAGKTNTGRVLVEELHGFVYGLVGGSKSRLLEQLIAHYPDSLAKEQLAELAGASATSSAFANNLGSLRSLGLIDYPRPGEVAALPILFLGDPT